jgi:hypothetical protein
VVAVVAAEDAVTDDAPLRALPAEGMRAEGGWLRRAAASRCAVRRDSIEDDVAALAAFKQKYVPFFVSDFEWCLKNYDVLRSTADEFILVADGKVEPFNGDLDDYRQWLEQRTRAAARQAAKGAAQPAPKVAMPVAAAPAETPKPQPAKSDETQPKGGQRQKSDTAGQRKPIEREIAKLEQEIERLTTEKARLDAQLGDPDLYLPPRAAELSAALARSAEVGARLEAAETDWMARQETLTRIAQA